MVTRADLVTQLAAIEHMLDTRITVVRIVIDEHGHEVRRIYRPLIQPRGEKPLQPKR